jgi:hypothetical protein
MRRPLALATGQLVVDGGVKRGVVAFTLPALVGSYEPRARASGDAREADVSREIWHAHARRDLAYQSCSVDSGRVGTRGRGRRRLNAQGFDKRGERRRLLPPAGFVEEEARERLTPRLENADQRTLFQVRRRAILPEVCHADAVERRTNHEVHIVHDQWTVDRHRRRLFAFIELPAIDLVGTVAARLRPCCVRNVEEDFSAIHTSRPRVAFAQSA